MTITWSRLLGAFLALALAACDAGGPKFKSTDITGVEYGRELALTGHDGRPRTLAEFRSNVDHSAQSFVIDPQGRLRLFLRHDRIAADLADDLRTLLRHCVSG